MNSQVKKLPKSQVEMTVSVPYEDYMKAEKRALSKINKETRVDGFRSGHVPESVLRQKVPQETIQGMTIDEVLPISYTQAVKEHGLQVVGRPKATVKTLVQKEGDSLVYTAVVDVMPEVKLGDYKKIKVKKPEFKLDPKEVEATIDMIMERFAKWKNVDRKVQMGDRVEADFEGFDEEGKAIPNTASKNHPIVLGKGVMIPGFEDAMIGMGVNETKEFDITFPKEYHAKALQGKKVKFKLTVKRLEEKEAQVLDAAMVKQITGQDQSPQEFRKELEEDLKKEHETKNQDEHDSKVVQQVIKILEVELPESLIQEELRLIQREQKSRVESQGMSWEQYLNHIKKTDEDFEKDHLQAAQERVKARLAMSEIINKENLRPTEEEVQQKIEEITSRYPKEQESKVREYYKKGSEAHQNIQNNLAADKLIKMFTE